MQYSWRNKKIWIVLGFVVLLQVQAFAIRDFGKSTIISHSKCSFEGTYTPNTTYDIKAYIKDIALKIVKPSVMQVTINPVNIEVGTFIAMSFYNPYDQDHKPIEDLSTTGTEKEVEASSFLQLKAFPGRGNKIVLSPVVYKKGYRGEKDKQDIFANPFGDTYPIKDEEGNILGGDQSFFTKMMITVAGKGTYKAENTSKYITPDKEGRYTFFINLNPKFSKQMFFIVGITKISIFPSGRGLRSPIITTPLDVETLCK